MRHTPRSSGSQLHIFFELPFFFCGANPGDVHLRGINWETRSSSPRGEKKFKNDAIPTPHTPKGPREERFCLVAGGFRSAVVRLRYYVHVCVLSIFRSFDVFHLLPVPPPPTYDIERAHQGCFATPRRSLLITQARGSGSARRLPPPRKNSLTPTIAGF